MLGSRVRHKRKRITRTGIEQGWGYGPLLKFIGGLGRHGPLMKICGGTGFDGPLFNIIVWEDIALFGATGILVAGMGGTKKLTCLGVQSIGSSGWWVGGKIVVGVQGSSGLAGSALTTGGLVQAKGLRESWGVFVVVRIGRES